MKYLTLLHDLDYRGSQRVAQNYTIGMHKLGHEVRVLTTNTLGERAQLLEAEGISSACTQLDRTALSTVLQWSPDIVHVHRPGMYDPKLNPILEEFRRIIDPVIIETSIFSRVDYKIPPNVIDIHLHLTRWCLWKWWRWSQVLDYSPLGVVLPYSVMAENYYRSSAEEIYEKRQSMGIPVGDFVFGRIGAYDEGKWHPILIDAFQQVSQVQKNISLLLVSPPPSVQKQVENLPSSLRKKVIICPRINSDEELRLLYSTMDVMIHAARIGESFGMVLVEALLCETPVITLSSPMKDNSQVEIVQHQKFGIVANNETAFADAMKDIAANSSIAREWGCHGRNEILNQFDNKLVCTRLEHLCNLTLAAKYTSGQAVDPVHEMIKQAGFITNIATSEIYHSLQNFGGRLSNPEKFLMNVVHHPVVYKLYSESLLQLKHKLIAAWQHNRQPNKSFR